MFEQYNTEELIKLARKTDDNEDMRREYSCREIAESYKDFSDYEVYILGTENSRYKGVDRHLDSLYIEYVRRRAKAEGESELPIDYHIHEGKEKKEKETPKSRERHKKFHELVFGVLDEAKSEHPDKEKIKKLDEEMMRIFNTNNVPREIRGKLRFVDYDTGEIAH